MESYTALRRSSLKKDYTKITVVLGTLIAIYALFKGDYAFVAFGLVAVYVSLYSKDVVIDSNGMTTYYHAILYNKNRNYPFSEFTELRVQRGAGPEIIIGFVRKGMNTNCIFKASDAEAVINLATEINPRLHVREIYPRRRM